MTMAGMRQAFKEWAVICRALAEGRQALIIRKGGIAERGPVFEPEPRRFWLYPTWSHQKAAALVEEGQTLLEQVERDRPAPGVVRLSNYAEVVGVYHVHDIVGALKLTGLHLWAPETVQQRFFYRQPGLYVLAARVYTVPETVEVLETAAYAGCRSWVELDEELSIDGAAPVLDDENFRKHMKILDLLLQPTALA
jgi:hypothetical protein